MRYISNDYNLKAYLNDYEFDTEMLIKLCEATTKIKLDLPNHSNHITQVLAKVRTRSNQTRESLDRLHAALIPCEFSHWLQTTRKITKIDNIYSIDFSKLRITDLYDFYICPDDVYLDRHGDRPVIGPVFADFRNGKLAGICIRNLSSELNYASDVKFTFSNFGWFLFGFDDYNADDVVYIVEGIFDVIALRAYGYNAIAIGCSTPSPMQLAMLLFKFKNFYLCLDNDLAGCIGALRCKLMLNIKIFTIAEFKDIAQCWETNGKLELVELSLVDLKMLIIEYSKKHNDYGRDLPYNKI